MAFSTISGVTTNNVYNIASTSATIRYTVTGTFNERGYWIGTGSATPDQTGTGTVPAVGDSLTMIGTHSKIISSLTSNTTYKVCGYRKINSDPTPYVYGDIISFVPGSLTPVLYNCYVANDVQISSSAYQFDVYIKRTGDNALWLNNYQLGFELSNVALLKNNYMTGEYVANSCEISGLTPGGMTIAFQAATPPTHLYDHMDVRINGLPPNSSGTEVGTTAKRIGTFIIRNYTTTAHTTTRDFGKVTPDIGWDDDFIARTYIYAMVPNTSGTRTLITNVTGQHTISTNNPAMNTVNWKGGTSAFWSNTANWLASPSSLSTPPSASDNVYIATTGVTNNPTISGATTYECDTLTLNSGRILTIASDGGLKVNGTLTNNAGTSGLVIQSTSDGKNGSLIHSTTNVDGTFQRYMNSTDWANWKDGWHFLGSPVTAQTIATQFTTYGGADYDFYLWNEPTNEWINYKNTTVVPIFETVNGGLNFVLGKGYLAAYKDAGIRSFTGKLNVTDVSVSGLTLTGTTQNNRSWHLLGNPFSSALNWDASGAAWTLTNIGGVAQIWNELNQSYSALTSTPASIIPATNGFMVQVSAQPGSLTIPASKRLHSSQTFYKSTSPFLKLLARNPSAGNAQESIVIYNAEATTGFDLMYDGDFLPGYAPQFYSVAGEEHLSVNALPEIGGNIRIPFNFVKNDGIDFTIEAVTISDISGPVILKDFKTNNTQDLSINPVYSFTSADSDNPARFEISFNNVGMDENASIASFAVYTAGNDLVIIDNTGAGKGFVAVYNLMGQVVAEKVITSSTTRIPVGNLSGYFLVKVTSEKSTLTKKLFID